MTRLRKTKVYHLKLDLNYFLLYLISNRPNETKVLSTQRDADTTSDTAAAVDSTAALVDSAVLSFNH